jgi:hypothetical protein
MKRCSKLVLAAVLMIVSTAQADITFDFNTLGWFQDDVTISAYMSALYEPGVPSSVTTDGAVSAPGWIGTNLFAGLDKDFEISFNDVPIIGAQFIGYVLAPSEGADFTCEWYNGGDLVGALSRDNSFEVFDSGWLDFSGPVDRMRFSNAGVHDIAIDDLTVRRADLHVPVPGAVVLGIVGLGVAGAVVFRGRNRPAA